MIETWIEQIKSRLHMRLGSLEQSLLAPAQDMEIAQAEQAMGVIFPEPLKRLYRIHNGEAHSGPGLFFGLQFLTLDEMVHEWKIWSDLQEEYADLGDHYSIPADWIQEQYINRHWIPFCHDGGGNHLGVDLNPGPNGIVGQVINFGRDEETKFVIARDVGEFIRFMHHVLESGNYTIEQEDGIVCWMYGRDGQARLLRDAQQYAFGAEWAANKQQSAAELAAWAAALPREWQERIEREYSSAAQFTGRYQLYLPNAGLSDITPLAACTEVRELSLSGNEIVDLSPLASCRELKKLYVLHNPVCDLSPLAQLPYLRQLNISDTNVTTLEPLARLTRLTELECERIPAHDYRPLLAIQTLECLSISSPDREQAEVLGQMNRLKHLTVIDANGWDTEQWAALGKLPLLSLTVTGVQWANMEHLQHFKQLKQVTLANLEVNDISGLAALPSLQKLKLAGDNGIANLETIAQSSTLSSFTGDAAQVELLQTAFQQPVAFSVQYDGRYYA
ncbi:SMI1/KNR4 family protein [Paenibacillus campi]|uniref:SMI1/KNR4 family protein n=1 Tax=Paenibacillus campi TaxID=3106031 RepID=UPI002B0036B2|nr:SMI1/KNR4 family protein [Paenibacillus sp. SGZ-1014]